MACCAQAQSWCALAADVHRGGARVPNSDATRSRRRYHSGQNAVHVALAAGVDEALTIVVAPRTKN
jgi:hypothetical protein